MFQACEEKLALALKDLQQKDSEVLGAFEQSVASFSDRFPLCFFFGSISLRSVAAFELTEELAVLLPLADHSNTLMCQYD